MVLGELNIFTEPTTDFDNLFIRPQMLHHLLDALQPLHPSDHTPQKKHMHSFNLLKVSDVLIHHLGT